MLKSANDTHREKLCFIQFSTKIAGWLLPTFLICLHNQLSSIIHFITRIKSTRLKNMTHQVDSKNEWLLVPASFKSKSGLVFVLTLGNDFS